MTVPVTSITNRNDVFDFLLDKDHLILAQLIEQMADDMRDLIEANRRYALDKYGDDRVVEDYYCVKKMRERLFSLGYQTKDEGGIS